MRTSLSFFILLSIFTCVLAQEEGVTVRKSTDKVILEGKVYYIHYVREKETLYSISRAYNISEKVIALENPDLAAGLKAGMVLKIPADPVRVQEIEVSSNDEFRFHIVTPGETIYSLSRKYGVTVEEIRKHNPEVEYSDLQINQVLKIPRKPEVITPDTIIQIADTILLDSMALNMDSISIERWLDIDCMEVLPDPIKHKLTVGLFLPLALRTEEILDSLALREAITKAEENPDPGDYKWKEIRKLEEVLSAINPRIIGFLDFYEGVLLALDSLKNEGISIDLYVYDTERDTIHFDQILQRNEMNKMDMIFGPVEIDNLKIVADFGKKNQIPVISPFTDNQVLLRDNPYFIQMVPSQEIEFRNLARFLTNCATDTLLIIYNGDSLERETVDFLKQALFEEFAYRPNSNFPGIKEIIINDSAEYDMSFFLADSIKNIIIIPSANEAYVSNMLTALFLQTTDYDIQVFGMSNWHKFQSIDLEYLHLMGINYYTSFFVDYKKEAVKTFVKKFRRVYKTEPYRVSPRGYNLSMYGFDLMYHFATLLANYRNDFTRCPVNLDYTPMLGTYLFRKAGMEGGFMNQFSIMIEYGKDFEIRQLKIDNSFYPSSAADLSTKKVR